MSFSLMILPSSFIGVLKFPGNITKDFLVPENGAKNLIGVLQVTSNVTKDLLVPSNCPKNLIGV